MRIISSRAQLIFTDCFAGLTYLQKLKKMSGSSTLSELPPSQHTKQQNAAKWLVYHLQDLTHYLP